MKNLALSVALLGTIANATVFAEDLPAAARETVQAYRQLKTYHVKVATEVGQDTVRHEFALDRAGQRLRIEVASDDGSALIISDGKKLRVRLTGEDTFPDRYVEAAAPEKLDTDSVSRVAPFADLVLMPELVFLLADNPIETLGTASFGGEAYKVEQTGDGFRLTAGGSSLTFKTDPKTRLIRSAVRTAEGFSDQSIHYTFDTIAHAKGLPDSLFAFDTAGAKPVKRFDQLLDAPKEPAEELVGQAAPDFTLKTLDGHDFTLSKATADIVVLDFWATWCGPCVKSLPGLQKLHEWAAAGKKPIAFYAVNMKEDKGEVQAFWDEKKLTMPVLLETDGAVAGQYKVEGIPQTVIIHKGKIAHVHVGAGPGHDQMLKEEIEALLGQTAAR